jgi:hypothetical protein
MEHPNNFFNFFFKCKTHVVEVPAARDVADVDEDVVAVGDDLGDVGHGLPDVHHGARVEVRLEVVVDLAPLHGPLAARHRHGRRAPHEVGVGVVRGHAVGRHPVGDGRRGIPARRVHLVAPEVHHLVREQRGGLRLIVTPSAAAGGGWRAHGLVQNIANQVKGRVRCDV